MNITVLRVRHPETKKSPIIGEMIQRLTAGGAQVTSVYPDEIAVENVELAATDLVVLKAKTPAALVLARRYHEAGVRTFTHYPVTELCRDKIVTNQVLSDAGVPIPATYSVDRATQLAPLLDDGPLVVKPYRGSQGQGVQVVHTAHELLDIDHGGDPVMAQRYYAPDSKDLKIYRIGDEVFGVERPWPPQTYEDKIGRLVDLSDEVRHIAFACGDALGIDLYGVDVILHQGRPWVVDLSSFPGFKGVPDAGRRLADHILRTARSAASAHQGSMA